MDINLDDILRLKKQHPCGSYRWQVVRLGADIGLKCVVCHHRILIKRGELERLLRCPPVGETVDDQKRKGLETQIAELKARMPAHSVKPAMLLELEKLEEELEKLERGGKGGGNAG